MRQLLKLWCYPVRLGSFVILTASFLPGAVEAAPRSHKRKFCEYLACEKTALQGGLCSGHGGGRRCGKQECSKFALQGGFCVAHGGGKRCRFENCERRALSGGLCHPHGGGKRCRRENCERRALSGGLCYAHGGSKRCAVSGCDQLAKSSPFCVSHGGGKRCEIEGCRELVKFKKFCLAHLLAGPPSQVSPPAEDEYSLLDAALGLVETPANAGDADHVAHIRPSLAIAPEELIEEPDQLWEAESWGNLDALLGLQAPTVEAGAAEPALEFPLSALPHEQMEVALGSEPEGWGRLDQLLGLGDADGGGIAFWEEETSERLIR
ncbi:MAG: hypothetical protein OXT67_13660 [Zetaproteobacteria bacterium]|nr:hypothetical protein [Zetaproteobacteria bacterium]